MKFFALTNIGYHRKTNQDSYCIVNNTVNDVLMLVCDGVGGANAGDVASATIVNYFSEHFSINEGFQTEFEIIEYLKKQLREASDTVYRLSLSNKEYQGMGTTITGVLFSKFGTFLINVGDSRVYIINHDNQLVQKTADHTVLNKLIMESKLTYEEAVTNPQAAFLTNCAGMWLNCKSDIFKLHETAKYFLICSDGLHSYVEKNLIEQIIVSKSNLQTKTKQLMKAALAAGGIDNITIILVKVGDRHG